MARDDLKSVSADNADTAQTNADSLGVTATSVLFLVHSQRLSAFTLRSSALPLLLSQRLRGGWREIADPHRLR